MDDVSGVAGISRKFATFLTISRKLLLKVIGTSQILQKIISQTNIFNIFPSSVPQNSVVKIYRVTE